MRGRKGFTLVELIMVIVILGILAIVAIPRFFNLSTRAEDSSEQGVVGGVRAGIQTAWANADPPAWPTELDPIAVFPTTCSTTNPCFEDVLAQGGITSDQWERTSDTEYTGPTGTVYVYDNADGSFQ